MKDYASQVIVFNSWTNSMRYYFLLVLTDEGMELTITKLKIDIQEKEL